MQRQAEAMPSRGVEAERVMQPAKAQPVKRLETQGLVAVEQPFQQRPRPGCGKQRVLRDVDVIVPPDEIKAHDRPEHGQHRRHQAESARPEIFLHEGWSAVGLHATGVAATILKARLTMPSHAAAGTCGVATRLPLCGNGRA
jgi:hypothetical protein